MVTLSVHRPAHAARDVLRGNNQRGTQEQSLRRKNDSLDLTNMDELPVSRAVVRKMPNSQQSFTFRFAKATPRCRSVIVADSDPHSRFVLQRLNVTLDGAPVRRFVRALVPYVFDLRLNVFHDVSKLGIK